MDKTDVFSRWRTLVPACLRRPRAGRLAGLLLGLSVAGSVSAAAPAVCPELLDRRIARLQDEQPQSLCQYHGKVILVVNTASLCGNTPQYRRLEALYGRYRDQGLVVLGFPSNDFGTQEPGSNGEIAAFCESQFGVSFPMFVKGAVRGAAAQPLFVELARRSGRAPDWNFHKYLIDRTGRHVQAHVSGIDPLSPAFTREIDRWLAESAPREKGRKP